MHFHCHTDANRGSPHIKLLGAVIHELGSTGLGFQSVVKQLMTQLITSEAKASALLQIGPLKDFIS